MDRRDFVKKVLFAGGFFSLTEFGFSRIKISKEKNMLTDILNSFELSEENVKKLLSLSLEKGGDFSEIYLENTVSTSLKYEEGILKKPEIILNKGVGIRVVSGEKFGYSYSESFDMKDLGNIAKTANNIMKTGFKKGVKGFKKMKNINRHYPEDIISEIKPESKIKLLKIGYESVIGKKYVKRVSVSYADEIKIIVIANSDGLIVYDIQPLLRYNIEIIGERSGKRVRGYEGGGGRYGLDYFKIKSPEDIANESFRQMSVQFDAKDSPAGEMKVVLASGDSGILLHESIGHPLEADFNRKKTSAFSDRIGEKVACSDCTIIDSGIIQGSRGSINIDDEGNPSSETILIEKGVLKRYMHDRISSGYFKTKPTGNGRRESYEYYPLPRMTNTYLDKGKYVPEEIIRSVRKGIFVKNYSGGEVNITNGDFVFKATEAYMIENGKIGYPLKGVTLIGNGPDILTKIDMVGNDLRFSDGKWTCGKDGQSVPVGVGIPTVRIKKITVGGSSV
jgi:TldD protein